MKRMKKIAVVCALALVAAARRAISVVVTRSGVPVSRTIAVKVG